MAKSTKAEKTRNIQRCSNCFQELNEDYQPSSKFYYELYEDGIFVKKKVLIIDALKEIYNWRLFGTIPPEIIEENFNGNNIYICGELCGVAIAKLYTAIKAFDSLTLINSVLHNLSTKLLDCFPVVPTNQSNSSITTRDKTASSIFRYDESKLFGSEILNRPITRYNKLQKTQLEVQVPASTMTRGHDEIPIPEESVGQEVADLNYSEDVESSEEYDFEPSDFLAITSSRKPATPKPFLCHLCGAGLNTRQSLRTHQLLSHKIGTKNKGFVCEVCNKEFVFQYLLRNHEVVHQDTRNFTCPICDMKFKTRHNVHQHQRDVHLAKDERKYDCKLCPKAFKQRRTLWEHIRAKHGNKGKPQVLTCKYGCGSTTSRSRSLLNHHRKCRKRPKENDDETQDSVNNTSTSSELQEAALNVKPKQYPCKWDCGKVFTRFDYRAKHSTYICRNRPNMNIRLPKKSKTQKKTLTAAAKNTKPLSQSQVENNNIATNVPHQEDNAEYKSSEMTEEPIETETVFDDITFNT